MRHVLFSYRRIAMRNADLSSMDIDDWAKDAACTEYDPDIWFPEWPKPNEYGLARRICQLCPVRKECLIESLERGDQYGMFGGLTPGEREKLKHRKPSRAA